MLVKNILSKLKESAFSILPIAAAILIAAFAFTDIPTETIWLFVIGCVLAFFGLSLFSLGADTAMMPIGDTVAKVLTRSRKLWLVLLCSFVIGVFITVAEPDLMVLATSLANSINKWTLIIVLGVGMGTSLLLAVLRVVVQLSMRFLLFVGYALVFILAAFLPPNFVPLAFDSGGVTTGPMTVPFIMALGAGIASMSGTKKTEDSFGFVALSSIGPIVAVTILGLFVDTANLSPDLTSHAAVGMGDFVLTGFVTVLSEVAIALAPIVLFFLLFKGFAVKDMPPRNFVRILIGLIYTYVGLVLFLTGVSIGFKQMGTLLGAALAENYTWLLIPFGMLVGFMIVAAEPSVHVLNKQVEQVSGGTITKNQMLISLMFAIAIAVGLAMVRVVTGISIWWIITPGYVISLIISFFVPKEFTAIAFDSGGVASGPMTVSFLLYFACGATAYFGGNILEDAYGMVAMVAMAPLLTIQLLGLSAKLKQTAKPKKQAITQHIATEQVPTEEKSVEIIDLD